MELHQEEPASEETGTNTVVENGKGKDQGLSSAVRLLQLAYFSPVSTTLHCQVSVAWKH